MKVVMDETQSANREEALDRALKQIEKAYGKGAIMQLDQMEAEVEGISTGALSLDLALGGRGLPRGRIIEMFGPESSGPEARRGCRDCRRGTRFEPGVGEKVRRQP